MGIYGYLFNQKSPPSPVNQSIRDCHFRNKILEKGGYWVVKVGIFK
jgi:hypothetical protein